MKTLKTIFLILSLALPVFIFTGSLYAESDGAPVKRGNKLVCSDCTTPGTIASGASVSTEVKIPITSDISISGIMPVAPKEAEFEEELSSPDTLMLKDLKPVVPSSAGFNDEDPVMTIILKHAFPHTPSAAGFDDPR